MTDRHDDGMSDDVHALSGSYAVDALDDEERVRFEAHLRMCPACREEVDGLREATAALAADAATEPPTGLRDRLLAEIANVRPLPPVSSRTAAPVTSLTVRRRLGGVVGSRLLVAAAVLVLVAAAAAALWRPWSEDPQPRLSAAEQVLTADDAARTEQALANGAAATVVVSRSEGRAVLLADDLPPAPAGKDYQLWLQTPSGRMTPAGLLPAADDVTYLLDGDASEATAVGITIEPKGGSPQPTTTPIALFDLPA